VQDARLAPATASRGTAALIEIEKSVEVAVEVGALYEYLLQPANIAEYVGPIRRIDLRGASEVRTGTRVSVEVTFLGIHFVQRAVCTIDHAPERFECRSVGGRFNFTAGFTLSPTARGARLEGWGNASAPSLFRFAEPVVGYLIERQVERDLARLRKVLGRPRTPG
jgi:hypothetical protein